MNDKIYKSFYLFLLNLGIVSLVLFALHKLSLLRVDLIFNESWLFAILIFSFTFCIAVKDKLNRSGYLTNRNIETIFEVSPYFFLSILVILAVNQFLKLDFLTSRNFHIVVLGIAFGFLAFYKNRDQIENDLESEKRKEQLEEGRREDEFDYKFPRINRIWGLRRIVKWMYVEGWWYVLALIVILTIFTLIKLPYFGVSFTGENILKYNTYVEPAKWMFENNNPFLMQWGYLSDPLSGNPLGKSKLFGGPPIIEWSLFIFYKLFNFNSLEFNTRLVMHLFGILVLLSSYSLFSKWFSKRNSLLITFLISINPIINLFSFVTVEDVLLIVFTFLSLIYITKYLEEQKINNLFFSGIFLGLGVVNKYSIFLWLFPIIFVLLIKKYKGINLIKHLIIVFILSVIPSIVYRSSLQFAPGYKIISFITLFIWFAFLYWIYKITTNRENKIKDWLLDKRHFGALIFLTIFSLVMVILFILVTKIYLLFGNFLTDFKLLFNWKMYSYMLNKQFKIYSTPTSYYLGLIGLLFTSIFYNKRFSRLILSFALGSVFYWIMASKVIFFHNYYTSIIMITLSLSASMIIIFSSKLLQNKKYYFLIYLIFLILITPSCYQSTISHINKETYHYFIDVADYLKNNLDENEVFVRPGTVHSPGSIITLYSGRASISPEKLLNFGNKSLKDYNIKYFLVYDENDFSFIDSIINSDNLDVVAEKIDRTDILLNRINGISENNINITYNGNNHIKDNLTFDKEINGIKIYRAY